MKFVLKQVEVLFKFDSSFIKQIDFSGSKKILLEDSIFVNYSKENRQAVPISAKILAPELTSTKELIDFGNCLIGQERCHQFIIRNPSSSALLWNITIGIYSMIFDNFF